MKKEKLFQCHIYEKEIAVVFTCKTQVKIIHEKHKLFQCHLCDS